MKTNTILQGDCLGTLDTLPDGLAHTCVTSPPYFGLRDYGVDGQIGLEQTPEQYVNRLVEVFRKVRRVLRDDGTLWLNLGDSYASSDGKPQPHRNTSGGFGGSDGGRTQGYAQAGGGFHRPNTVGDVFKPKDLIGIPWMVAFALRADGWYLRQDIIWHKPNSMPESVTDRCTKAHEYIFLLSKSERYYYDNEAIKEDAAKGAAGSEFHTGKTGEHQLGRASKKPRNNRDSFKRSGEKRNKRSVWTVATKPFSEAHFATFPQGLIVDCIKAGCPPNGVVLDPFGGAGTTALVSRKLGRDYVLCELNPEYVAMAKKRLFNTLGMFA